MFRKLKRLWNILKLKPYIQISEFGQLTPRPQVVVSLCSMRGAITLYSYQSNDQGWASAELNAKIVSDLSGLPLYLKGEKAYDSFMEKRHTSKAVQTGTGSA